MTSTAPYTTAERARDRASDKRAQRINIIRRNASPYTFARARADQARSVALTAAIRRTTLRIIGERED